MTGLLSHTLFNPGGMRGMDFPNPTPTLQHSISNTPGLPKPLLFTKEDQSDWAAMLPLVQFALNNHSIWGSTITPFQALHRYKPAPILELTLGEQVPEADKFLSDLQEVQEKLWKVLLDAQDRDKETYDQHVQEPNHYKSGDLVYLDSWNLPLQLPTLKLGLKSVSPFPIAEKIRTSAYHLVLPSTSGLSEEIQ